jgi:hypothetical protein
VIGEIDAAEGQADLIRFRDMNERDIHVALSAQLIHERKYGTFVFRPQTLVIEANAHNRCKPFTGLTGATIYSR